MIWLAKDMTTLYSMRAEDRATVMASLREVWDGKIMRDTGQGKTLSWWGKVTMIGAATRAIEGEMGVGGMGERFMTLRWKSASGNDLEGRLATMEAARRQLGRLEEIRAALKGWITSLCDTSKFADLEPPTNEPYMKALDHMAELTALLRVPIERDHDLRRSILAVGEPELPTRMAMMLAQLIRTHQALLGGLVEGSMALAHRLVRDTVPQARRRVLACIPMGGIDYGDLSRECDLPPTALYRILEDLTVMKVLDEAGARVEKWESRLAVWHPDFERRMKGAGLEQW
jgi:hypothetical protein